MNAQTLLDSTDILEESPIVTLSMSFFDLHHPETILPNMKLLQNEFPGMFRWAGEINLVKQALWKNDQGKPVPIDSIPKWAPFMKELQNQDIPMAIHMDLGNDVDGLKFLPLMDKVLSTYPDNKIIWVHLAGLSKELAPKLALLQAPVSIQDHVKVIQKRLDKYPNLFIDLSWDVLFDNIYQDKAEEKPYIDLINTYPTRFLSGSDHVAAESKTEATYSQVLGVLAWAMFGRIEFNMTHWSPARLLVLLDVCLSGSELGKTNAIYHELSDEAFQNIALGGTYFKLAHLNQWLV